MGLLDFFKSFGSKTEEDQARRAMNQALVSLDIGTAIDAHGKWKERLLAYLDGDSNEDLRPEVICKDDRCDLGKWIHSDGQRMLGNYSLFSELRSIHRSFHQQASSVVSLHQSGKQDAAKWLLDGEYTKTSERIVRRLKDLQALNDSRS